MSPLTHLETLAAPMFSIEDIVAIVASLTLLVFVLASTRFLGRRYDLGAELQRKTVHIATGSYALLLPLMFDHAEPVLLLSAIVVLAMAILRLPGLRENGLGAAVHAVERQSYGDILLVVAVAFTFARSSEAPILFVLPIAVIALSDAAAALAGVRYGKTRFAVEAGTKSVEGAAVFFLVTVILSMTTLLLLTDAPRENVVVLSVLVAAFATLVEAESWRGFDNLFVPVGVHIFLTRYLDAEPHSLAIDTVVAVALIGAFLVIGSKLKATSHASRAAAVLVCLILASTTLQNTVLPIAALAAHLYARRHAPCDSAFPDLDFLAAAALIGLFWLFLGDWIEVSAINLFNLTFAVIAVAYLSVATTHRAVVGLAATIVGAGVVLGVAALNHPDAFGAGPPWSTLFFLGAPFATVLGWLAPQLAAARFTCARALRFGGLGMSVPLLLFAMGMEATR